MRINQPFTALLLASAAFIITTAANALPSHPTLLSCDLRETIKGEFPAHLSIEYAGYRASGYPNGILQFDGEAINGGIAVTTAGSRYDWYFHAKDRLYVVLMGYDLLYCTPTTKARLGVRIHPEDTALGTSSAVYDCEKTGCE